MHELVHWFPFPRQGQIMAAKDQSETFYVQGICTLTTAQGHSGPGIACTELCTLLALLQGSAYILMIDAHLSSIHLQQMLKRSLSG